MTPEERSWEVVRRAFEERTPRPRPTRARNAVIAALVLVAALVAAVLSPSGHAVFERVRRAVGVEHATPTLGSLPAAGKLLVLSSDRGGVWVVDADGAKRRIGAYQDAQWSPHGRFVVAANHNELLALDPKGHVRWTLSRRGVTWPTWEGTSVDTRIAYVDVSGLRVVAGDGTGDRLLDPRAKSEPPAWDRARLHVLAYERGNSVFLRAVDGGRVLWRARVPAAGRLVWSTDGSRLAVVAPHRITVLSGAGKRLRSVSTPTGELRDAAFEPGTHRLAVERRLPHGSEVVLVDVDRSGRARLLFAGPGAFGDLAWSPDGRWLLVDWPTANQWVFLHGARAHAVARIAQQFPRPDGLGPLYELSGRWCCSTR